MGGGVCLTYERCDDWEEEKWFEEETGNVTKEPGPSLGVCTSVTRGDSLCPILKEGGEVIEKEVVEGKEDGRLHPPSITHTQELPTRKKRSFRVVVRHKEFDTGPVRS